MTKFSDELLELIRVVKKMYLFDGSKREVVLGKLKFLFHACVASEDLLVDASVVALALPSNEFNDRLASYYQTHLEEEKGEVAVLLDDLASAKTTPGDPSKAVMAMVGTQYYMIKHVHPVSLLGYMAVQEADPTPINVVELLENLHGKALFRFLRMHAIKDLEHRKELIEVIDSVPEELRPIIYDSAKNALGYLNG